jgi:formate dehydrogenase major subunit
VLHQIWAPYHWGSAGVVQGDSTNDLFGITLDPNVLIQESKVTTCDVRPGRRPHGPELVELVDEYRRRAGVTVETGTFVATVPGLRKPHLEEDAHGPQPGHHAGTRSGPGGGRRSEGTAPNLGSASDPESGSSSSEEGGR